MSRPFKLFRRATLLGVFALFILAASAYGQRLEVDFDRRDSSNPEFLTSIDDKLIFSAHVPEFEDVRLFAWSDETGLEQLMTLSEQPVSTGQFAVLDNRLYFAAESSIQAGHQIWEYDGSGLPRSVHDLGPRGLDVEPAHIVVFDGRLLFEGYSSEESTMWSLDSSGNVKQPHPSHDSGTNITDAVVMGGNLYYVADGAGAYPVIWRYDGREPPEPAFKDGDRNWNTAGELTLFHGALFFNASERPGDPDVLWSYDGSGFPSRLSSADDGTTPGEPRDLVASDTLLFFSAIGRGNTREPWLFRHADEGGTVEPLLEGTEAVDHLTLIDGRLYFTTSSGIWRTDSELTPQRVSALEVVGADDLFAFQGRLYFSGEESSTGREVWRLDADGAPTLVVDVNASGSSRPSGLVAIGDTLYMRTAVEENAITRFSKGRGEHISLPPEVGDVSRPLGFIGWNDRIHFLGGGQDRQTGNHTRYLFAYDPASEHWATYPTGGNDEPPYADYPDQLIPFDERLFFAGHFGATGHELWSFDGTGAPGLVADVHSGSSSSTPRSFLVFDDMLYFIGAAGLSGYALYRFDGSTEVESVVRLDRIDPPVVHDGALFYGSFDGLWRYDGASQPELIESDFGYEPEFRNFTPVGSRLFFTTENAYAFWKYDQADGVTAFDPGVERISEMTAFGDRLCFSGRATGRSEELWCYNPDTGTSRRFEINPDGGSEPAHLTVDGDRMYFVADDGFHGRELWSIPYEVVSDVDQIDASIPVMARVSSIYPNPARSTARLEIEARQREIVLVEAFDVLGRRVVDLSRLAVRPGESERVDVDLAGLAAGVYFVRVTGSRFSETRSVLKSR